MCKKIKYKDKIAAMLALAQCRNAIKGKRQAGVYPIIVDGGGIDVENVKPYLFPLSSMTEEQENEWDNLHFNPLDTILEGKFNGEEERLQLISKAMTDPIRWCYKNNFDCNGLIPLGLAIDATGKNIY